MSALLDHLWQSTLFTGCATLLVLALRHNSAAIRHGIWVAASVKFLLPFSALTALATWLMPVTPELAAPSLLALQPAAQPFAASAVTVEIPFLVLAAPWAAGALAALWAAGTLTICAVWLAQGLHLAAALRRADPLALDLPVPVPIPVKESPLPIEPGLVGILRPVILLPRGIAQALSAAEIDAILAHELAHWRRRDNLLAAIHMLVTALFWFHPMVWWIGARLNAERENACDEAVLEQGKSPQLYAACILKVCRLYLQSPLPCAAGVAGANLRLRVEAIMANRLAEALDGHRLLLLGLFFAVTLMALPVAGVLATVPVQMRVQAMARQIAAAVPRIAVTLPGDAPVARPASRRRTPVTRPAIPAAMPEIAPRPVRAVPLTPQPISIIQPVTLETPEAAQPRIVCRPPQAQTHTRLRGPATCAPESQWAALKAKGLDFAPDGRTIITANAEKARSVTPPPCLGSVSGVGSTGLGNLSSPCL